MVTFNIIRVLQVGKYIAMFDLAVRSTALTEGKIFIFSSQIWSIFNS